MNSNEPDLEFKPAMDNNPKPTSNEPAKQVRTKQKPPPTFLTLPLEIRQQIIFQYLIADEDWDEAADTADFVEAFIEKNVGDNVNEIGGDVFCMAEEECQKSLIDKAKFLREAYPQLESEIVHPLKEAKGVVALDEVVTETVVERWRVETFHDWYMEHYQPYTADAVMKRMREEREERERVLYGSVSDSEEEDDSGDEDQDGEDQDEEDEGQEAEN